jgi:hemoglobin
LNTGVGFDHTATYADFKKEMRDQMIDDLYDLIGGRQTVWAATEAFYKRVFADDTLSPFFKTTDMAQLCSRQSMFISMLLGGRVVYTGKDIHGAHAPAREQGLNDRHFDRFLRHFREALNEVGVEADKVEKVTKLLESKRNAVLNP